MLFLLKLPGNWDWFQNKTVKNLPDWRKEITLHPHSSGEVAQSVEQRTENPCVGGSIPSFTTIPQN